MSILYDSYHIFFDLIFHVFFSQIETLAHHKLLEEDDFVNMNTEKKTAFSKIRVLFVFASDIPFSMPQRQGHHGPLMMYAAYRIQTCQTKDKK